MDEEDSNVPVAFTKFACPALIRERTMPVSTKKSVPVVFTVTVKSLASLMRIILGSTAPSTA